jgi:hypothetical protein
MGVAARVEEMAAARNLRMEGGGCSTWGREKREDVGRVAAKGGKGGSCPQGALREGRLGLGGGEVGFPPLDRDQRPKTIPTPELLTPAHTSNIHFTDLRMLTS